jgi:DNA-binding NarL/FixJ family response regulator
MKSRPSKPISVVIIEDHRMFREQLVHLINKADDMKVCGHADNIRDGLALIKRTQPDIAIVDITLRGSSGLELLKDLRAHGMAVPTLVLSMHDESLYAERALRAGAKGYVTKHEASESVLRAIRQISTGEIYLKPQFMSRMIGKITAFRDVASEPIDRLADRELEVFDLIGRGLTTREVAARLGLGITTVDTYKTRIREKLNLENSARLRFAASRWVQLGDRPSE